MSDRARCPVFVMGCPRSGTNLLYDTLLSSGGFAVFRGRVPVHQILIPRFGKLDSLENRKTMMATWLCSEGYRRSELDAAELTAEVLDSCRNGGDFLQIVMNKIARNQGVPRWAAYDPDTVLRVPTIKREIPQALFVHMIRDGRDIALSLRKLGGFHPFPWYPGQRSLEETVLYWEWMVKKGHRFGRLLPRDYLEVRYEDLVEDPRQSLRELSNFLDHDLDYDRIRAAKVGTLGRTNSSFREEEFVLLSTPVRRWRKKLSQREVGSLEWYVGNTLEAFGYKRTVQATDWKPKLRDKLLRAVYPIFLERKQWLKINTRIGRFSSLADLQLIPRKGRQDGSPEVPR